MVGLTFTHADGMDAAKASAAGPRRNAGGAGVMLNFEKLKRRRDKEWEERQAAKALRKVTQSVGPTLRSRHARMAPRRSIDEVKKLRASLKFDLNAHEIQRAEEEARALADFEASEPTPDPRSLVPILAGAPAPPPILPPGRTRTAGRPKSGNSASIDV